MEPLTPEGLGQSIMREVVALHASHPHVPALELFDLVMKSRRGSEIELPSMEVTPPGPQFATLLVKAFMPYSEEELGILEGDVDCNADDFYEADEMRPEAAARLFFLHYELNGFQQREAWARSFADASAELDPSILYADAHALGLQLWADNWQMKAPAFAYWRNLRMSGRHVDLTQAAAEQHLKAIDDLLTRTAALPSNRHPGVC